MKTLSKGFTLIELILVVLLISIIVGLTLASYNSLTEERKLTKETEKFHDILELAKKKASTAENTESCSNYSGYSVEIVNSYTYTLNILCSPVSTVQTYSIGQELSVGSTLTTISILKTSGQSKVEFKPLTGGTTQLTEIVFTLQNPIIGKCIPLRIAPNAVINKDPEVAC